MTAVPAPEFDTARAVLDSACAAVADQRAADARLMLAACTWADLHPADTLDHAATVAGTYGDRALRIAGSHAPMVTEFAVAELASRMGRSTVAGSGYLGESLACRHLLPRLWDAVLAHRVDGWRARLVARTVIGKDLTPEAAAFVDQHVTPVAQTIGLVALERLVAEAFARLMPDEAELEREEALDRRRFEVHLDGRDPSDLTGTIDATGTFDLPDGILLHDAVAEEKQRLRALGATEEPGPLSAQALVNLVVRGTDGASTQGVLDLAADGAPGPATTPSGVATGSGGAPRRYLLHLHLSDAALRPTSISREDAGDAAVGRVEETRAPVTATAIRDWLGAETTTQVTVLPVLDLADAVHAEAYEVPRRLQQQTALTHLTCVYPYCNRRATRCDHDHAVPYDPQAPDAGGPTCSCNIAPLCRTHHRLKTHGHAATRWTLTPLGDGAWLWRSAHGAHYLRDHTGTRPLDGPLADTGPTRDTGPPGDHDPPADPGP